MSTVTVAAASFRPGMGRRRFARIVVRRRFIFKIMSRRRERLSRIRQARLLRRGHNRWSGRPAIRCAVMVAGVAAVLSLVSQRVQVVFLFSLLWTVSGSIITLALYQHRRPLAWMDAGIGARIGLVVGLALVACLGVAWAADGWWRGMSFTASRGSMSN